MKVNRTASAIVALALAVGGFAASASADEVVSGGSAANPIVVADPADVPEGAVEDKVSTFDTAAKCDTTRSWVQPGSAAVVHDEGRYLQAVPAVEEVFHEEWNIEGRSRTITPAVEEVSHKEFRFERSVDVFKTQYHFRKYTQTKTCGSGSSAYGEYGPWTAWVPETHTSWEDSDAPIGAPAFHGEGNNRDGSHYYRVWQARFDGQTREVKTGTKTETTDWVRTKPEGNGWTQTDERKFIDTKAQPEVEGPWSDWTRINRAPYLTEPTAPANTRTHEYRVTEPTKVVTTEAVPAYTAYYVEGDEPSFNREDASWVESKPEGDWTLFEERTVTDAEAIAPQYFAWSDGVECETVIVDEPEVPVKPETVIVDEPEVPVKPATVIVDEPEVPVKPATVVKPTGPAMLAQTGADGTVIAALTGAVMLALGVVAVIVSRRRRPEDGIA